MSCIMKENNWLGRLWQLSNYWSPICWRLVDANFDTSPYNLDTVQWNAILTSVAYESAFLNTLARFELARRNNVLCRISEAVSSTDKINRGVNSNQITKAGFPTHCRSKRYGRRRRNPEHRSLWEKTSICSGMWLILVYLQWDKRSATSYLTNSSFFRQVKDMWSTFPTFLPKYAQFTTKICVCLGHAWVSTQIIRFGCIDNGVGRHAHAL
jgi:hypothetical protein